MVDTQRETKLVELISITEEKVKTDLTRYETENKSGDIRKYLDNARQSLDQLLTLREQPHIIMVDGTKLNPDLYTQEDALLENVVYNALMALSISSQSGSGQVSVVDSLKSKSNQIEANFTLSEAYVAMGVCIPKAQGMYQMVIEFGEQVFNEMKSHKKENKGLIVPMMRLAYKIGTSYKRLLDIDLHILKSIETSIEVYADKNEMGKSIERTEWTHALPYGHLPLVRDDGQPTEMEFRARLSTLHPYLIEARKWLNMLQDFNHTEKITDIQQLEFSHYQFMLYLEDLAQLKAGCVFNVYNRENGSFGCISDIDESVYERKCPNRALSPKELRDMEARAEVILVIR